MKDTDALSILSAKGFSTPLGPTRKPAKRQPETVASLFSKLTAGDRGALGRAITLVESHKESDQDRAAELLDLALPLSGNSVRVGITGSPGVGKSSLIEAMGLFIVEKGVKLAALAVDPSSPSTFGSILGDKSRMPNLAVHDRSFIRPSPSSGRLGGVANQTREVIQLCEAAGFGVIFVETVGVGQSEVEVRGMVDCFLLLAMAGAGDELQGIKRGIMEMADVIGLTKADGENRVRAEVAAGQLERALMMLPADQDGRRASVNLCSAVQKTGIEELWTAIQKYIQQDKDSGRFDWRRRRQSVTWMEDMIQQSLLSRWLKREDVRLALENLSKSVEQGAITPRRATQRLLDWVESQ